MINKIKYIEKLKPYIADGCEENEYAVTMADDIPAEKYVVIKVDDYYNELGLTNTPPSIDCLIVLKCGDNSFMIYLVELKNVKSPDRFDVDNIYNKLKTTIHNFMSSRFKNTFLNLTFEIKKLHLFFVTIPYRHSDRKSSGKREGTKMEVLLLRKPFKFRGKRYQVKHKLPNPLIQKC